MKISQRGTRMIQKESLTDIRRESILMQGDEYAYILPNAPLNAYISNFTISFPNVSMISNAYTIMPHGSVTLVIFEYGTLLHSFLFGPTTKPKRVGDIANKCECIFIIEFQPAGFFPFTGIQQQDLKDSIIPFMQLDTALDWKLRNCYCHSNTANELLMNVEDLLLHSIQYPYSTEFMLAVRLIIQAEGTLPSQEVSDQVCYSLRHLNRLFQQYVGIGIKAFSRLVRINKAIRLLNQEGTSTALVCDTLQYYDVSHFVKDFRNVCGITPQEYKVNMSDFYSEIAKF